MAYIIFQNSNDNFEIDSDSAQNILNFGLECSSSLTRDNALSMQEDDSCMCTKWNWYFFTFGCGIFIYIAHRINYKINNRY